MDPFVIGIFVGAIVLLVAYSASVLHRLDKEIAQLNVVQKILLVEQGKIRQITESTLGAAETFVDALRESANGMMGPPQKLPEMFDDLRQSFENGIRQFEEEDDENESP